MLTPDETKNARSCGQSNVVFEMYWYIPSCKDKENDLSVRIAPAITGGFTGSVPVYKGTKFYPN